MSLIGSANFVLDHKFKPAFSNELSGAAPKASSDRATAKCDQGLLLQCGLPALAITNGCEGLSLTKAGM